jgi:hypothetical protein
VWSSVLRAGTKTKTSPAARLKWAFYLRGNSTGLLVKRAQRRAIYPTPRLGGLVVCVGTGIECPVLKLSTASLVFTAGLTGGRQGADFSACRRRIEELVGPVCPEFRLG